MPGPLTVDLNRDRHHGVEVATEHTVAGSFPVEFDNHGDGVHVHLALDEELSRVASVDGGNHYVEGGSTDAIEVRVDSGVDAVTGSLSVVTGYGAETARVAVTVDPDAGDGVAVDEELAEPPDSDPKGTPVGGVMERFGGDLTLPVVGLGVAAAALALGVGLRVGSPAVLLGAGVVVGVVLATVVYLLK